MTTSPIVNPGVADEEVRIAVGAAGCLLRVGQQSWPQHLDLVALKPMGDVAGEWNVFNLAAPDHRTDCTHDTARVS